MQIIVRRGVTFTKFVLQSTLKVLSNFSKYQTGSWVIGQFSWVMGPFLLHGSKSRFFMGHRDATQKYFRHHASEVWQSCIRFVVVVVVVVSG